MDSIVSFLHGLKALIINFGLIPAIIIWIIFIVVQLVRIINIIKEK